jgi:membrane protein
MPMMRSGAPYSQIALRLLKRTATEWSADNATRWSASVAFYTLLSLAPLLALTIAIAGLVYGRRAAQGQLVLGVRDLVGPDVGPAIQILLKSPHKPVTGFLTAVFGTLTLFFGASAVMTEVRDALNTIWHVPLHRDGTHFANLFRIAKERLYSFAMILVVGLLLLVSLILNTWLATIERLFGWQIFASSPFLHVTAFLISPLVITLVFAGIYKFLPNVRLNWGDVAVGAVVTSLLFMIGKELIALYMEKTNLGSAYGAAGSFIVVLAWVYYSAQVFFFGAEFTKVYAETFGSQTRTAENRNKLPGDERFERSTLA